MTTKFSLRAAYIAFAISAAPPFLPANAENLKLPPEVTPALRAACEHDVRRLCIAESASVVAVKSCVVRRYIELSARCKLQIAAAGMTPAGR